MRVIIEPSQISGEVMAATSKSAMQRACAAALLRGGKTSLSNPGKSNDDLAAMDIIKQLGAKVTIDDRHVLIESEGVKSKGNIDCGESGLSVRMFTPIAALSEQEIIITGSGSLMKRPVSFFDEVLPRLGVQVQTNSGLLPMTIKGPLIPSSIRVDGSLSSQFLTGLLFAFSVSHDRDIIIDVDGLNSKPYIDLTLKIMKDFGLNTPLNIEYQAFHFQASEYKKEYNTTVFEYNVEGDWSGAAFLLVAGAVSGTVQVKGLDLFSTQADRAVLQPLMNSGARLSIRPEMIEVSATELQPFHFNANDCPDLFPPLVALASFCNGKSVIEGVNRLTHKESNRALTLQEEFGKLGVVITLQDDLMIVEGGSVVRSATVSSHHDHRIAMACAIAALRANGNVTIEHAEAINKSYPAFYEHLSSLGVSLRIENT